MMQSLIKMPVKHTNTDYLNYRWCKVPVIRLLAHTDSWNYRYGKVPAMMLVVTHCVNLTLVAVMNSSEQAETLVKANR